MVARVPSGTSPDWSRDLAMMQTISALSVAFVQSEEAALSELRRSAENSLVTAGKNKS
jgi:hypothetical protein